VVKGVVWVIGELVSGDMVRRELRDMAAAHGESVVKLASASSFGISVRDGSGRICLVAMLDAGRNLITDVAAPLLSTAPAEVYQALFDHLKMSSLSVVGVEGKCGLVRDTAGELHSIFDMPEELELDERFYLHGAYDIALPRRLRSTADFILIGARITSMCQKIEIGGDADFSECEFETFPDRASFHRNLVVRGSTMRKLPRGISVGRWLKMSETKIEAVPVSARIGLGIDAENSTLRIIPPGFTVAGDLLLSGTRTRRLSGVSAGGNLFVERIANIEIGEDCEIGGNIYTDDADIRLSARHEGKAYLRVPFGYERMQGPGDV
jgi:hypothetical protein